MNLESALNSLWSIGILIKRISLIGGHFVACDPAEDDVRTLGESFSKELTFQEFESFRAKDELFYFGFQYVMDLLKANIVASNMMVGKQYKLTSTRVLVLLPSLIF